MKGLEVAQKIAAASLVFLLCLQQALAQDANCDFFQNVALGQTYYIYSPGYPNNYNKGITCRWQAQCPDNTRCRLNCPEVSLPATAGCAGDRLLISKTGDPALIGAHKYCGLGTLAVYSASNIISVGLISTATSPGGTFLCTLSAEPTTPPTATCDCGWKKGTRIVGGVETEINEFPMMVALVDIRLKLIYCGATIISPNHVLTAAHCVADQQLGNVGILIGEHNIQLDDSPATKLLQAAQFITHPQFTNDYDYDIALIKTVQTIVYSDLVGPACLPFKFARNLMAGFPVEALGWGTASIAGADSTFLQKVSLDVVDQDSCTTSLGAVVNERTICSFNSGKDACQHDSGGPLLYQDTTNGREYIIGVIIGGYGCATSKPGLNTRITEYLNWITQNTPGVNYCRK